MNSGNMIREWYEDKILKHLSSPDDPNFWKNEEEKTTRRSDGGGGGGGGENLQLLQVGSENFAEEFLNWMGEIERESAMLLWLPDQTVPSFGISC